jgi:hypothetical protein
MSEEFNDILKRYKKTVIYLLKLNEDKSLIDVLKIISIMDEIKDEKKKADAFLDVKNLYYKNILKKEIEIKLDKRIG